jgi:hypothetical protein
MVGVHSTVGTLVLVAFLTLTVLNAVQLVQKRDFPWGIMVSRTAALLLVVQWALGLNLLVGESSITPFHYIIALASIATVGLEHGPGSNQPDPQRRRQIALAATAGTLALVLIAYLIGTSR